MFTITEILLVSLLGVDLALAASSRLFHCIRLVALQGILLGILPVFFHVGGGEGMIPPLSIIVAVVVSIGVKGILLPLFLVRAMRKTQIKRELEPYVGYSLSLFIIMLAGVFSFWFCRKLGIAPHICSQFALPVAFTTMLTGLFLVISRKKAITQALGFLVFENGIGIFGAGMLVESGLLVELGILLDVVVLVFVMGITLFQIQREFRHMDSDHLKLLGDWKTNEEGGAK